MFVILVFYEDRYYWYCDVGEGAVLLVRAGTRTSANTPASSVLAQNFSLSDSALNFAEVHRITEPANDSNPTPKSTPTTRPITVKHTIAHHGYR